MKLPNKYVFFGIASAILLAAVVGAWCVFRNQKTTQPELGSSTQPIQAEGNSGEMQASDVIDTSNWKTYRNEKYGFEFKYPSEIQIKELKNASCIKTATYYCRNLSVSFDSDIKPINFWLDVFDENTLKKEQRTRASYVDSDLGVRTNSQGVTLYGPTPAYANEEFASFMRSTYAENGDASFLWFESYESDPLQLAEKNKIDYLLFSHIIDTFRFLQ